MDPATVPVIFSFPPTFFFSFSQLCSSFPLSYTYAFFPSLAFLFFLASLPCSFNLPQKKKTIVKEGRGLLSFLHLCCCRFQS